MKSIAIAMLALLLMSVYVYADDAEPTLYSAQDVPVDETTARQVKAMVTPKGAEVRLLQLEKSIERNILFGEKIIERLEANYSDFDTSGLEALLEELRLLKEDVAGTDTEGETPEVVKVFVDLKNDARDIAKQFRELVHEVINGTEAENLRSRIGGEVNAEMSQIRERIRNAIRNHNEEVVSNKLQLMKKTNTELVEKVRGGEYSKEQVKTRLRDMIQSMTPEERSEAVMAMKRTMTSLSVRTQSAIQAAEEGYRERLQERLTERIQSISEDDRALIQERLQVVEAVRVLSESSGNGSEPLSASQTPVTGHAVRGGNGK